MSASATAILSHPAPGVQSLGSIDPLFSLATFKDDKSAFEPIAGACSKCQTPLMVPRLFAAACACDPCRAAAIKTEQEAKHAEFWAQEHLCPRDSLFQETSPTHPDFPKAQFEMTKGYSGTESLLFFGVTGKGKTRLAMMLLRRCLFEHNLFVGILWPEDLKTAKGNRDRRQAVSWWGRHQVLLMDDSLMTGAQDENTADFLRDLLDYRMRHKRHQIITSQIGGQSYKEQMRKWESAGRGSVTTADEQRVEALLRRINQLCRVIPFLDHESPVAGTAGHF